MCGFNFLILGVLLLFTSVVPPVLAASYGSAQQQWRRNTYQNGTYSSRNDADANWTSKDIVLAVLSAIGTLATAVSIKVVVFDIDLSDLRRSSHECWCSAHGNAMWFIQRTKQTLSRSWPPTTGHGDGD